MTLPTSDTAEFRIVHSTRFYHANIRPDFETTKLVVAFLL